jgi:glucose-1-phosphate cytidylyltransferase
MVEIGGKPILWHIMNIYAAYAYHEFVIALGYKAEVVKEYFLNFFTINNDLSVDLSNGKSTIHKRNLPNWLIHLIDTGLDTQTGGRIKRLKEWIGNETFMMTYGDGLSNVNISDLVAFHKKHKKLATVTAVHPPARFGGLILKENRVIEFSEKNQAKEGWINGGFFVLEPEVFDYIENDQTLWEKEPLERLAADDQLMAYFHSDFWQPMDTLREFRLLESHWQSGNAPWKTWKDNDFILERKKSICDGSNRLSRLLVGQGVN